MTSVSFPIGTGSGDATIPAGSSPTVQVYWALGTAYTPATLPSSSTAALFGPPKSVFNNTGAFVATVSLGGLALQANASVQFYVYSQVGPCHVTRRGLRTSLTSCTAGAQGFLAAVLAAGMRSRVFSLGCRSVPRFFRSAAVLYRDFSARLQRFSAPPEGT